MNLLSRNVKHPSGFEFKTPLLVPSFSSKGFETFGKKSELKYYLDISCQFINESYLISAYDSYYNYLHDKKRMNFADLIFLDSGGYEISTFRDFSEIKKMPVKTLKWNQALHSKTIKEWNKNYNLVIISYDSDKRRKSFSKQISSAVNLFKMYPNQMNDFLIKPEKKSERFINFDELIQFGQEFDKFNIVGVTEKEAGDSMLERMKNIRKLRKALDSAGINSPIHIFGCLDPISCILYYSVGAEIFDGLTWLRYSYYKSIAIYLRNYNILNEDLAINTKNEQVIARSITDNIYFLEKLKNAMVSYSQSKSFVEFNNIVSADIVKIIEDAFKSFNDYEV